MKAKKITSVLCALALVFTMAVSASAQEATSSNITSAKTPIAANAVTQKWANEYLSSGGWGSCGTPLAVGSYIYVTDNNSGKLLKLDAATGATIKSAACSDIAPFFSMLAYGDGKIYVPQQTSLGVRISAFDADTLAWVWQSPEITQTPSNLQIAAPITYYNQHIYFGTYEQDGSRNYISGKFVCLNTADGKSAWQYSNPNAGYYCAGGTIAGNSIIFGDTAGNLASHDLLNSTVYNTAALGDKILSTPCYSNGKVYVSVYNGNLVSIPLKSNSTFEIGSKITTKLGNNLTSSPVVYNGRVYVAGGGGSANTPFSVLNADTLAIIYQISGIHSQSTPLISTAYATAENHQQVYIYVTNYFDGPADWSSFNAGSSCTYLIKDSENQTTPSYEKLTNVSVPQSCTQSVVASDAGWLYYYNDSGNLFAFAPTEPVAPKPAASAASTTATATPVKVTPAKAAAPVTHNSATGDNSASVVFFGAAVVSAAVYFAAKRKNP